MAKATKKQTFPKGKSVEQIKEPIAGVLEYTDYREEREKEYQKQLKRREANALRIMKVLSGLAYSEAQGILRECRDRIANQSIVK